MNIEGVISKYHSILKVAILLFFTIILAYLIYKDHYLFFAFFGISAILLIISISDSVAIILLFLIVFAGEQFSGLTSFSQIFIDILLILLIAAIFFKAIFKKFIQRKKLELIGIIPVLVFSLICLFSLFFNGTGLINFGVFLRFIFQFYLFFIALLNIELSENQLKYINIFLIALFVIQIPTAIIKWFAYGYSDLAGSIGGETAIGTYGGSHGAMSTVLPLFAIGFLLPMYIWTKKKSYLLLIFGFVVFSFLGGKRALMITLPFFVIVILYICYIHIASQEQKKIFIKYAFIGISFSIFVLVFGTILNPSMNPSQKIGGKFDLAFLKNKIISYETGTTSSYDTVGRLSSTIRVISVLSTEGVISLLLGKGAGIFVKSGVVESTFRSGFQSEFGIVYGFTGFVWMFSQVGLLGVLCYLIFLWNIFKKVKSADRSKLDLYWQIFRVGVYGTFIVVLFDFFAYSTSFIEGKPLSSVVYYVIATQIIISNNKKNS